MSRFKVYETGISCVTSGTLALFQMLEVIEDRKSLSAAQLQIFLDQEKTYGRLGKPEIPFRPNPIHEPLTGMMIFYHPDDPNDTRRMIGLYYDLEPDGQGGVKRDENGELLITPRRWLIGPKATAVIPYQWSCCGGWSAILAAGDSEYRPDQPHKATATIIDPPTVQDHHAQFFNREDGGTMATDNSDELEHAVRHLLEAHGFHEEAQHDCSRHAPLTSGGGQRQPRLQNG